MCLGIPGKVIQTCREHDVHEIAEGVDALDRSTSGLFISGLSAGLDVGLSLFLPTCTPSASSSKG